MENDKKLYKLVLTGGPCGGKTTGQAHLCTFFENLGWKVLRVPETASILLTGGVKFSELSAKQAYEFQEDLLKTMLQIENTFFKLAQSIDRNCLIICDRGAMDATAFVSKDEWKLMAASNGWNNVELRDNRYDHIIHMVSSANGAEDYYTTEDHSCRCETIDEARDQDRRAALAWIGHPYYDVIGNSENFDNKICRLIECVCRKLGLDIGDRFKATNRKVKFLVTGPIIDSEFPAFQDFEVIHDYLKSGNPEAQARLRKRGQNDHWSYIHTLRRIINGQAVEVKTQLNYRDYTNALSQRDSSHLSIFKRRRCFLVNNQYFQLDIYQEPAHPRCRGLMLLETYTDLPSSELSKILPQFLNVEKEVTNNPEYSMFNLSFKEEWNRTEKYFYNLNGAVNKDKSSILVEV